MLLKKKNFGCNNMHFELFCLSSLKNKTSVYMVNIYYDIYIYIPILKVKILISSFN